VVGVAGAAGLSGVDQFPISEEKLAVAENRELRATFIFYIASQLNKWVTGPIWEDGSGVQLETGLSAWRERRASKKAGKELARQIELDDFVDAAGYLAQAEMIISSAFYDSLKQTDLVLELCDDEESPKTPLVESMQPYRPDQGRFFEEMLKDTLPTSVPLLQLFEETSDLFDLIYLNYEDGVERLEDRHENFSSAGLGGIVATPLETRLRIPDLDGAMSFREQAEASTTLSMMPFNIQVMEHCYAIMLGEKPDPGIITDGPISRHGRLDGFRVMLINSEMIGSANYDTEILARIS